ncbi:MAG: phenylacetate-CoA oxygenase subunit PaaC [Chitinophagaceae bacterium]|nr:phenylacetate-CoA oxygenase subunit PaaC [Chitinophagaceae bacterium]
MSIAYILHLADNALVLGHRNSEWTGHGPILEQDIALSNISLDLIGQARNLYQYAATLIGNGATEDTLAYLRDENEYKNCLLVELPNGHWGTTIMRQFLFSAYQHPLYERLSDSNDENLNAIARKSLKEVTYHLRWSSEWVIRLGQGTAESRAKMTDAVNDLWPYTQDLLLHSPEEKEKWQERVQSIFKHASLNIPADVKMISGGFEGKHTSHLVEMLNEMQHLQRTYPGVEW